jgi:hypothetical protein
VENTLYKRNNGVVKALMCGRYETSLLMLAPTFLNVTETDVIILMNLIMFVIIREETIHLIESDQINIPLVLWDWVDMASMSLGPVHNTK